MTHSLVFCPKCEWCWQFCKKKNILWTEQIKELTLIDLIVSQQQCHDLWAAPYFSRVQINSRSGGIGTNNHEIYMLNGMERMHIFPI